MRFASVKSLVEAFGISEEEAKAIRGLVKGEKDVEEYASVVERIRECYNRPSDEDLVLCALNEILEGCGVEVIEGEEYVDSYHGNFVASYVNMGDTYTATILLDHRTNRYMLTTWGDFVEREGI